MSNNSKNTNLFYKLYSRTNDVAQSGYVCPNALDEKDTSFDITNSDGVITDSNGDMLSSISLEDIHAEGITEYYTETKIIAPQSAYLLQGNVTGETYAAQFFPIVAKIQNVDNYEPFINVKFCINYVDCADLKRQKIDTYILRTQPGDVCEIIQAKLDELGIRVAVSIRNLEICDCEDMNCNKNSIDYLVFQSTQEGYQFFVYDVTVSAIDYSYENFNREWADYTESPFVGAIINFDMIMDLIRSNAPRLVGKVTPPDYDKVPCDLYKYFISIVPLAVNDADAFVHNYRGLEKFAELFDEVGELPSENYQMFVTLSHLYNDIYAYYFGHEGALLLKYNIHDILKMLGVVAAYIHSSNVAGPYQLVEDYDKRLGPQKYPNGALRGIVIVPDWPTEEDVELSSLRLAHVSDQIVVNELIDIPENMRIEGYICNGCKDVFIKHLANVKINTLLQSELEVYKKCKCGMPIRKVVSNEGLTKQFDDEIWTYQLHEPLSQDDDWTRSGKYQDTDDMWTGGPGRENSEKTHAQHHAHNHPEDFSDEYVDDYKVPSKYDWMARVPARRPNEHPEPHEHTVGLYGYMQYLSENSMWTNVGEGYMCIGLEDDYQSKVRNLHSSVLLYNPNTVPVRVRFMVFS